MLQPGLQVAFHYLSLTVLKVIVNKKGFGARKVSNVRNMSQTVAIKVDLKFEHAARIMTSWIFSLFGLRFLSSSKHSVHNLINTLYVERFCLHGIP
jgi:hypothetical protein